MKNQKNRPPHRPAQFAADLEGHERFLEKTDAYISGTPAAALSVSGWADALGVSRTTLSNYKRRGAAWKESIVTTVVKIRNLRSGRSADI